MDDERNALLEEQDVVVEQLTALRDEYLTRPMPFSGRWRFSPLAILYIVIFFYLLLGAIGVWLIFDRGSNWADLGIGLLVGALFGIGSLIAAMWEAAFNWWSSFSALVSESENDMIRERGRRMVEIQKRIAGLDADMDTPG